MRIMVISTGVFQLPCQNYAGLEVVAYHCAKGLAEKGHEVFLVAPDGSSCPGVTIIPIGPPGQWGEHQAYNTYWQQLLQVDCVLDHSWAKYSYLIKTEGRMDKIPIIGILHAPVNTMYQKLPDVEKPCFVCISEDQKTHFEALFSKPARRCYNGIDLDFYRPMSIKRNDRYLFLARFSTIKGPDLAIEVCKDLQLGLDLVGDTSITNEPEYLAKCKAMTDGERIKFVGPATRSGTVKWFSQSHCFLHPNQRFREPLGLAPLESQACGLPVIAWRFGAMSETVCHGETLYLVNLLDKIKQRIQEFEITDGVRKRCRDWASGFSIQRMV